MLLRTRMRIQLVGVVLVAVVSPKCLFANDMLIGEAGHEVIPMGTNEVLLASMYVRARIESYEFVDVTAGARRARVKSRYVYKNISDKDIRIVFGFPGRIFRWTDGVIDPELHNLKVIVDGAMAEVERRKHILRSEKGVYSMDGKIWKEEVRDDFRYVYSWNVAMARQREIIIETSYWVTLSSDQLTWWFEFMFSKNDAARREGVERVVVEIIYPNKDDLQKRVVEIKPIGYSADGGRIFWRFKKHRPIEDIRITERWVEKYKWLSE